MRVPAAPEEVRRARDALKHLALPEHVLDDARLLLSELLTNSIRHAGLGPDDRVRVTAQWSGTHLRVDVRDRARSTAPSRLAGAIRPAPTAESGWGLYLVDTLASRWGSTPGRYWFELEDHRAEER